MSWHHTHMRCLFMLQARRPCLAVLRRRLDCESTFQGCYRELFLPRVRGTTAVFPSTCAGVRLCARCRAVARSPKKALPCVQVCPDENAHEKSNFLTARRIDARGGPGRFTPIQCRPILAFSDEESSRFFTFNSSRSARSAGRGRRRSSRRSCGGRICCCLRRGRCGRLHPTSATSAARPAAATSAAPQGSSRRRPRVQLGPIPQRVVLRESVPRTCRCFFS